MQCPRRARATRSAGYPLACVSASASAQPAPASGLEPLLTGAASRGLASVPSSPSGRAACSRADCGAASATGCGDEGAVSAAVSGCVPAAVSGCSACSAAAPSAAAVGSAAAGDDASAGASLDRCFSALRGGAAPFLEDSARMGAETLPELRGPGAPWAASPSGSVRNAWYLRIGWGQAAGVGAGCRPPPRARSGACKGALRPAGRSLASPASPRRARRRPRRPQARTAAAC